MDERHWWVATKIQQTFKVGKTFQPEVFKSYLSQEKILDQLDKFFEVDSPKCLFVYRNRNSTKTSDITSLVLSTGTLSSVAESVAEKDLIVLYFIRKNTDNVIAESSIYKEILCGEIKGNPLKIFSLKMSEIFLPFFKNSKTWSNYCEDRQKTLLQNIERCSEVLTESGKHLPIMVIPNIFHFIYLYMAYLHKCNH